MKNPYANRWVYEIHKNEPDSGERALARHEAMHAEEEGYVICPKCGEKAWYRPGVGAYWCDRCNDPVR